MMLHRIIYNTGCKKKDVKKNIREFSGIVYDENLDRAKFLARIERSSKTFGKMRDLAKLLGVDGKATKEDLKDAICAFLEAPADHGAVHKSVAKKAAKTEKKEDKKIAKAVKKSTKKENKKKSKESKPKKPLSAYMIFSNEKRVGLVEKFPELPVTEIAKKIGELWKKADKEKYAELSRKMKEQYEAENQDIKEAKKQKKVAKKETKKAAKKAAKKAEEEEEKEEEK